MIECLPGDIWVLIAYFLRASDIGTLCLIGIHSITSILGGFHLLRSLPLHNVRHRHNPSLNAQTRILTVWHQPWTVLQSQHIRHLGRMLHHNLPTLVGIDATIGVSRRSGLVLNRMLRMIGRSCAELQSFRIALRGVTPACNLCAIKHMTGLRRLSVVVLTGRLGNVGVSTLANAVFALPQLEIVELILDDNELTDVGLRSLGSAFERLHRLALLRLSLAFNPITDAGLLAVCRPMCIQSLQLDIRGMPTGQSLEGVHRRMLAGLPYLRIALSATHSVALLTPNPGPNPASVRLLVHVSCMDDLVALGQLLWIVRCDRISTWQIVASRMCGTCSVVRNASDRGATTILRLFGMAPFALFLSVIHPTDLYLDLHNRSVWDDNHIVRNIVHVGDRLLHVTLQLNHCSVDVAAVVTMAQLPNLISLRLHGRHNQWNGNAGLMLGQLAESPRLQYLMLDLNHNRLGDAGVLGLLITLQRAPHLRRLVLLLEFNCVTPAIQRQLADLTLLGHTTLWMRM